MVLRISAGKEWDEKNFFRNYVELEMIGNKEIFLITNKIRGGEGCVKSKYINMKI